MEVGELGGVGEDAVVVRRKAAATLSVRAHGVAAHSGASPERGRSALLALAAVAQRVAEQADPAGPDRLTAVPTVIRSGEAFNVVPAAGELICDLRGERLESFAPVLDAVPDEHGGVTVEAELVRRWPGMDTRERAAAPLARASRLLGRPILAGERGGASDASHLAAYIALTIDGLGPLGAGAHNPEEYVLRDSLRQRAEVALALAVATLG